MQNKALVIIDIQNDTTKNYKDIINNVNNVIGWATANNIHVIYIRHENLSAGTRTFKPNTIGSELATDLKIVSNNIFTAHHPSLISRLQLTMFQKYTFYIVELTILILQR